MENYTYIYTLEYPEGNIRYVGKSDNPDSRFKRHITESKKSTSSHKKAWINGLLKENKKPILNIIDEVYFDDWQIMEQYWISQFKTWGFDLTNTESGGEGRDCGFIPWHKGKKMSKEFKLNMVTRKDVMQFNLNGVFLKKFNSITEAESETNSKGISNTCNNKQCYCNGYIWIFESDFKKNKHILDKKLYDYKHRYDIVKKTRYTRSIVQIDLETNNIIKIWDNIKEARESLNKSNIGKCLKNKRSRDGFVWIYEDEYKKDNELINKTVSICKYKEKHKRDYLKNRCGSKNPKSRKVIQLDLKTKEFIKVWDSISEARKVLNKGIIDISRACRKGSSAGGFKWKYFE